MSDDNVVVLDVLTTINLPPERILNAALEADLAALVIVGYDKNGEYYFHSSIPHGATINWLLDQCKKRIIDEPSDMRGEPGTEEQADDLPHLSRHRREAMTPANREELVGMLTRGFATSGVAFWTDATTGELLDALDATGQIPRHAGSITL
jgi:hypothetical protein